MTEAETLPALLSMAAARQPHGTALVEDGNSLSFRALERRSRALASGLETHDIGAGDRVAVWLPNRSDWLVCLFALARLGAVCVSVNTRFRAAEVEDIVGRARCTALVYEPGFRGIDFEAILAAVDPSAVDSLRLVVSARGAPSSPPMPQADNLSLSDLEAGPAHDAAHPKPETGVIVFTTSGTTSRPKFVLHTQRSLAIHAQEVARAFGYGDDDTVLLQALPLCGTFGLSQALAGVAAGRPTVVMSAFDAATAVDLIARHRVTTFNASDEMLIRIAELERPRDLASVKWCGFAAFTNAALDEFAERCAGAGIQVAGLYGMSEVQALYARQPLGLPPAQRVLAGGTLTSPGAEVQVRDPESGALLPAGHSGELCLKGPSRMLEYMDNPQATAKAIDAEGFVRSGDLGHLLEDGRFVFETRMGDGIRLGGFLVNPAEIDAWLERHPAVAASQTVGVTVGRQTRPVSFIIPAGAMPEEAVLTAHCRAGLAGFKVPDRIFTLERFPTTDGPNGEKVQRARLRDMAQEKLS